MIWISYFAQMRNFPKDFVPIVICGGIPNWYNGLWYRKVAPKLSFFTEWKKNHDNEYYIHYFNELVLKNKNPDNIIKEIIELANNAENIVLLCYEKSTDFCHRHLVANWINENNTLGINIKEWSNDGANFKTATGTEYCH